MPKDPSEMTGEELTALISDAGEKLVFFKRIMDCIPDLYEVLRDKDSGGAVVSELDGKLVVARFSDIV